MKTSIIVSILFFFILASCDTSSTKDKEKNEIPKALEDKSSVYNEISKRGYDDLVNILYQDLADKTPELKELESRIETLYKNKNDSTELFNKFNNKNSSYYNSANDHAEQITDSVLKAKMKDLISSSMKNFNFKISRHKDLLNLIKIKTMNLNDMHTILKITRTLPIIEKYQNDNLPGTKSMNNYLNQLDEVLKYTDSLTKK